MGELLDGIYAQRLLVTPNEPTAFEEAVFVVMRAYARSNGFGGADDWGPRSQYANRFPHQHHIFSITPEGVLYICLCVRRLLVFARNTVVSTLRSGYYRDKQTEDQSVADIYSAPPDAAGSL